MIHTNLNITKMIDELETRFTNIKNKNFIKDTLNTHLKYNMISNKEYNTLVKKYLKEE